MPFLAWPLSSPAQPSACSFSTCLSLAKNSLRDAEVLGDDVPPHTHKKFKIPALNESLNKYTDWPPICVPHYPSSASHPTCLPTIPFDKKDISVVFCTGDLGIVCYSYQPNVTID